MEIPPTILIIAGFIIIILGIGAGMLLSSLNEEGEPEEGVGETTPPGGKKGRYVPVARLWRERDGGALVVEMDGKSFLGPATLTDAQRAQLENNARDLRGWLGMGLTGAAGETAARPPVETARAAEPAPAAAPYIPSRVDAPRPSYSPVVPVQPALAPAEVEAAQAMTGGRSIVSQIEDILQDMIDSTPLQHQGLHLIEDPLRGVIVSVGGRQYEGIDAVPEGEARNAIRAAVAEWEKSQ